MLGLVFTEFIEMVEDRFSPETADAMLQAVPTEHDGSYTAVGYYAHEELVALVIRLSQLTRVAVPDLVRAFGCHLLGRFTRIYPAMFARHAGFLDFVAAIDSEIHVEVRKLYPQAVLPRFEVLQRDERGMQLLYRSPRRMESLALGLLEGLAAHYRQPCRIEARAWSDGAEEGTLFVLDLRPE